MTQHLAESIPTSFWQDFSPIDELPILAESRQRIRRQMQSNRANYQDLAVYVEADPALCLHLLHETVRQNPDCTNQITGATGCLSLLGMKELVHLVKHLPTVEANSGDNQLRLYRRCLHTAQFAGELAAHWTSQKGSGSADYARWSAALANAPLWYWLLQTPLTANWLHHLSQGHDLIEASRKTFGVLKRREWEQLSRHLQLPAAAAELFRQDAWLSAQQWRLLRHHDPRDLEGQRELLHYGQRPEVSVLMANGLAWHWHMAPLGRRSQRWLELTAHWLGKHASMIWQDARQLQVRLSLQQKDGLGTGLQWLLSPEPTYHPYPAVKSDGEEVTPADSQTATLEPEPAPEVVPPSTQAAPTRSAAEPEEPHERSGNDQYLKKLLRQLQQQPDRFGDWHFLLRSTLKGVTQGLGVPHSCAALMNKERTVLKVKYTEGMAPSMVMNHLAIDLRRPSLFSKILEKKASLLLTPANRDKFLRGLPKQVTDILPDHLLLMAFDAGNDAIGIVMAFDDSGTLAISAEEYRLFKQLCQTTSNSLAALRQNTRQRRP
ncbi:hypothetical protein GCM10011297_19160 [Bacterioplanes sanyensis]|uniref:HDOD domain-containing protein n=1 Tax=Bacterioplanes sanyensis TaxID=1249553 RepID=UPI00167A0596|nr:HDOD domain-containing protein [Bacterioplanes sanyensis]GGY46487.1 hypothetical protein GCM10011297_19160 [Bacterioplanes sanyensis]